MKHDARSSSVFAHKDYKSFLRWKGSEGAGSVTALAMAAGCQRSYLSRVINGEVHLTPDHAFGLTQNWLASGQITESERDYFHALVDFERASSPALRRHLEEKLKRLKLEHESLDQVVRRARPFPAELPAEISLYYSAWHWSALHVLTSIQACQTEEAMSAKLQLPLPIVQSTLEGLETMGLVRKVRSRWQYTGGELHVPKSSPLVSLHHNNWRQRAVLNSQAQRADDLHFTVVQSVSRDVISQLRQLVLDFVRNAAAIAGPSTPEELIAINCDFFRVD